MFLDILGILRPVTLLGSCAGTLRRADDEPGTADTLGAAELDCGKLVAPPFVLSSVIDGVSGKVFGYAHLVPCADASCQVLLFVVDEGGDGRSWIPVGIRRSS